MIYKLAFHPDARAEWDALDGSIRKLLKPALEKRQANPRTPGGELNGPLRGYYKIKLLRHGVRLVYTLDEERGRLVVVAVGRREDAEAYLAASSRIERHVSALAAAAVAAPTPKRTAPRRRS